MTKAEIIKVQREINANGLGPVTVDGIWGPATARAYAQLAYESDLMGVEESAPTPPAPKPWWQSRAILGGLCTIAAGIAALAGVDLDAGQLTETITALVTTVAGALALWGSIKRETTIDSSLVAPGVRWCDGRLRTQPPVADPGMGYNETRRDSGFPIGPFFDP